MEATDHHRSRRGVITKHLRELVVVLIPPIQTITVVEQPQVIPVAMALVVEVAIPIQLQVLVATMQGQAMVPTIPHTKDTRSPLTIKVLVRTTPLPVLTSNPKQALETMAEMRITA